MSVLKFNVITLFPTMIEQAMSFGVVGQALKDKKIDLQLINPRLFTHDRHQTVDDRPFGGGDSMVMLYEPLTKAVESLGLGRGRVVFLSAHGKKWSDSQAREWAQADTPITLICGRYAGADQRFINEHVDEEISVGDYILSGGELAALIMIDSVTRFVPTVLGNSQSAQFDSFADGLLEPPLFTRPQQLPSANRVSDQGHLAVPQVFLSGDHKRIEQARRALSLLITLARRPDLLKDEHLGELKNTQSILKEFSFEELEVCGLNRQFIQSYKDAKFE